MKVLSVASEAFPLVKTGGLADVVGALPAALARHGVEMRVLIPAYPSVRAKASKAKEAIAIDDLFGASGRLLAARIEGVDWLLLDLPALFDREGGPYTDVTGQDHGDNWRRFAALSRVAADIAGGALPGWKPDLVHAHDWQAGLTPLYMEEGPAADTPSVITVHNLAFQGQYGADIFPELGLRPTAFGVGRLEYYGDVSFLKGGLQAASAITTVSPTYAQEIRTHEFGMGLDGVVNARAAHLHGIVNGIDTEIWNPATDPHLAATYSAPGRERAANRRALIERFELDPHAPGPLFTLISRLTWQKGIDILIEIVDDLVAMGASLAILGAGDRTLEGALLAAAARHHGRVGMVLGYNEPLSHLMQAGGDAILVPSRFEPCGLTQLYGLRYGCVPVVARTGGLADTVIDANEAALSAGVATGFQFAPVTADALRHAVRRAIAAFADKKLWARVQKQGMKADVSWDRSAARYAGLYKSLIEKRA